jgi:predicted deacylase
MSCVPLALTLMLQSPLTIGSITARPGEMASGFLAVAAGVDSGTRIPITIVRGREAGPTLALVAGTHGSEVAPIVALQRVRREVDPARLRGTILMVHVANLPSFQKRTIYYSPIDGKNLNRVYPGRADGTVSDRIAATITREIIARADYLVDMHAGDGNEALLPYTYWNKLGLDARVDSVARDMALAWGSERIVVDTARPRDPRASVYTQNTAQLMGKPALTTEGGELGIPAEEYVRRNVEGVFRLLRYFRMLPGEVQLAAQPIWFERTDVLRSSVTGTWHPVVRPGEPVAAGALLGVITDFFGNPLAEVRAPFAGQMLYVVATPATSPGEPLGMVGVPKPGR